MVITIKYKENAANAKLNCVYPSIVGVITPEKTKIIKLKDFQVWGKIFTVFSLNVPSIKMTGISNKMAKTSNKKISNPSTSPKDQVFSNVFSPVELKKSKLIGINVFSTINIPVEKTKKENLTKTKISFLVVVFVPQLFCLSISKGIRVKRFEETNKNKKETKRRKK